MSGKAYGQTYSPIQNGSKYAADETYDFYSHKKQSKDDITQKWLEKRHPKPEVLAHPPHIKSYPMATLKHKLQHGHNWPVTGLCLSPDSDFLATSSKDIRLWETDNGRLRVILDAHAGLVRSLTFTPDNRFLISASDDTTIKIWDLFTCMNLAGSTVVTLTPPGSPSSRNPFMPPPPPPPNFVQLDTAKILQKVGFKHVHSAPSAKAGSAPGTSQPTPRDITGQPGRPKTAGAPAAGQKGSAKPSPSSGSSGAYPKSGPGSDPVISSSPTPPKGPVNPLTKIVQRVLRRHTKPVLAVAVSRDSKYCASGSADKTVRLWDTGSGYCNSTMRGHTGEVTCVVISHDQNTVLSGSSDRLVLQWDLHTGQCLKSLRGHRGPVSCLALAPDGLWFISGGHDGALRAWDLATQNQLFAIPAHQGAYGVLSASISADGSVIVTGGYDKCIRIWDSKTGSILTTLEGHRCMVDHVSLSHDCTTLASAGRDDCVRLWVWVRDYRRKSVCKHAIAWEHMYPTDARLLNHMDPEDMDLDDVPGSLAANMTMDERIGGPQAIQRESALAFPASRCADAMPAGCRVSREYNSRSHWTGVPAAAAAAAAASSSLPRYGGTVGGMGLTAAVMSSTGPLLSVVPGGSGGSRAAGWSGEMSRNRGLTRMTPSAGSIPPALQTGGESMAQGMNKGRPATATFALV